MKIKSVTFGSAIKFNKQMHNFLEVDKNRVEIDFSQGIVTIKNGKESVGVFTSNVKYFEPLSEPKAEELTAEDEGSIFKINPEIYNLVPAAQELQKAINENAKAMSEPSVLIPKPKPGRKPKAKVNE